MFKNTVSVQMTRFYSIAVLLLCASYINAQNVIVDLNNIQKEPTYKGSYYFLNSNGGLFDWVAGYNLGFARINNRGYENLEQVYLNGIPTQSLISGRNSWSMWGGLNDMARAKEEKSGLSAMDFSLGRIGGNTNIDLRPGSQRRQLKFSLLESNQNNYNHRTMLTWSTGWFGKGWAFSAAASRRWAQEGYQQGTFYDAYSYYIGVEKMIKEKHRFSLFSFAAPSSRGKSAANVKEVFDLLEDNQYNSYWGYQNGKKRNSRVDHSKQPVVMGTYEWKVSNKTRLNIASFFQKGFFYKTALDWYTGADPRPDYYRNLPSYSLNNGDEIRDYYQNNPEALQVNWERMYHVNRLNNQTIEDVDGIVGNSVTGNRSIYILGGDHADPSRLGANFALNTEINNKVTFQTGINYSSNRTHYYKEVVDLLGGEFYFDVDKFALRDLADNEDASQSDLLNPNRIVKTGDQYNYNYDLNVQSTELWAQSRFLLGKFDGHLGVNVTNVNMWRKGNYKVGKFPDNSLGESQIVNFLGYGIKGGSSYAITPQIFIKGTSSFKSVAPLMEDILISSRTRNDFINTLEKVEIQSNELGLHIRKPKYKLHLEGYYTTLRNQTESRSFYHDEERSFVNHIMTGVDKSFLGVESAFQYKITPNWEFQCAGSVGQHIYTSRPNSIISQDNNAQLLVEDRTVYLKNFKVTGSPQSYGTVGMTYYGEKYFRVGVVGNYIDRNFLNFNPDRRTKEAIAYEDGITFVETDSELWKQILHQEKLPSAFTIDINFNKSFRIDNYNNIVNVMFSVRNVLNKKDIITGGYEQLRFDYQNKDVDKFSSKYYFGRGTTFFLLINYTFRGDVLKLKK